ncbi:MAG: oxidoreductase [Gammaproteobacteria bacterium]|nr:oxidoreductase [Gammaproteobacteria bacterium]
MNNLLIWPIVLPLLATLAVVVWPRRSDIIGLAASLAVLLAVVLVLQRISNEGTLLLALGGWEPGLGIALRADAFAAALALMVALVALAAGIYATGYFTQAAERSRFWSLWLLLSAALYALLFSADIFNLYVTLELLGLSAVALAALKAERAAVDAAIRYLVVGLLGSLMFLAGVALVYARYGTLDMIALGGQLQPEPAAWVALSLMSAGLLVKSALFPLHFWLPPAHANAPAPVSAALSALVVKAAFYLLARLWLDVFNNVVTPDAARLLGVLGAAAILWGSWKALQAQRLKLMAAYSTVAQLGYLYLFLPLLVMMPPGTARDTTFGAMLLLALTHGFAKSALFLSAGIIQQRAGHDRIAELGGTARRLPVTTFTLALAGVALIGLPPSGAFLAKWELLSSAFATGQWPWIVVVALGSLLAAAYTFRVLGHAFGPGEVMTHVLASSREEIPALLLALIATLVLGLGAASVWQFVAPGAFVVGTAL